MGCVRFMISLVTALGLVAAQPVGALTIDTFEEGAFSLVNSTPGSPVSAEQSGLASSNVVGGVRLVFLGLSAGGPVAAALAPSGGDDAASMGQSGTGTTGSFVTFKYDGLAGGDGSLGIDLTADGADRFEIVYTGPTTGASGAVFLVDTFGGGLAVSVSLFGSGVAAIPLSAFGSVDLTSIDEIVLTANLTSGGSAALAVSNFSTVPEPSATALLAFGVSALALRIRM